MRAQQQIVRNEQFYMDREKHRRPENFGQARRQVSLVFAENEWSEKEVARFLNSLKIEACSVEQLTDSDLRTVLEHFEKRRMILYEN